MKHLKPFNENKKLNIEARTELYGSTAELEFVYDEWPSYETKDINIIKDIISTYNKFYIRNGDDENSYLNSHFYSYIYKEYMPKEINGRPTKLTKKIYKYPTINLNIETISFGIIELKFSIATKQIIDIDWLVLGSKHALHDFPVKVYNIMKNRRSKFISDLIFMDDDKLQIVKGVYDILKSKVFDVNLSIDETIEELQIDVENYFTWDWKTSYTLKASGKGVPTKKIDVIRESVNSYQNCVDMVEDMFISIADKYQLQFASRKEENGYLESKFLDQNCSYNGYFTVTKISDLSLPEEVCINMGMVGLIWLDINLNPLLYIENMNKEEFESDLTQFSNRMKDFCHLENNVRLSPGSKRAFITYSLLFKTK